MELRQEVNDPAFTAIVGEQPLIEHLVARLGFAEGPVWRGDHLLFTDIPSSRIVRFEMAEEGPVVTTFRYPTGNANGMTLDAQGRLITCEHTYRRVTRTEHNGDVTPLATRYQGRRLNSPNDVVVKSDGSIYFTDPPYGLMGGRQGKELDFNGVYRIGPDGDLSLIIRDMEGPNGLAFTPDESRLYVADSRERLINVFDVNADGSVSNGRKFADVQADEEGVPDGMKVDIDGNVYSTGPGGLWIFNPAGTLLGRLFTPEVPANCAWGDDDWSGLYLAARTGLYHLRLNAQGIRVGSE